MAIRIGISYAPQSAPYPRYVEATRSAATRISLEVEVIDLWGRPEEAASVDGIIFTGGGDIAPECFGKPDEAGRCDGIKPQRDAHEFRLCEIGRERVLPMLGICRGEQLLNVSFGGSLFTDIPTARDHVKKKGDDARHAISIVEGSIVARLAANDRAEVNSSHHQAIDRLAESFVVTAHADDGIIEAFEWADPSGKPFLLAVQWHPERMDQAESLAGPIFELFLKAVAGSFSHA